MLTTTHDAATMLLTLLARLARAEAEREALRAENARLRAIIDGPRIPRMDDDARAGVARLSE